MNVCFFSGDITRSGGTERVSSVIANELVKIDKMNICFLSILESEDNTFFPLDKNIDRYSLFDHSVSGKKIITYIRKVRRFIKEKNIDVLIDVDGILDMYSIPAVMKSKCKVISWEQFNYYQHPDGNYRKITRKMAARWADAIVVLTDEDKGYYQKEVNIRGELTRIYNPIERKEVTHSYDTESKMIISAGRMTYQKGFDILIDVARRVFAKHPDWKWTICGDGEDREQLVNKVNKYNLQEKIILAGNVSNIDDYYKRAAMYVLTSRFEGFGLVLTEAKKVGLPCVSFRCPAGPSEIIEDSINGYLIDCFDDKTMADKINYLIDNKEIRKEFSDKSLIGTEKFNIENIVKQWVNLLEAI